MNQPQPIPRLSAIDCAQRGVLSAWANWELSLVALLQNVAVVALLIAGVLPPLFVLGFREIGSWFTTEPDPAAIEAVMSEVFSRLLAAWAPLLIATLATLLVWFIAGLVYCACQGGTLSLLVAGDRRAQQMNPWPGTTPPTLSFRSFGWRQLLDGGHRYLWRVFWFINLYVTVLGAVLGLWLLVVIVALMVAGQQQVGAAFAVGCIGSLPVLVLFLAIVLWYTVAYADLGRETSGVWAAARTGRQLLGRRFGAVLLLFVVAVAVSLGVGLFFAGVGMLLQLIFIALPPAATAISIFLTLVQWLISGFVQIAWTAATIALVRSEVEPPPEVAWPVPPPSPLVETAPSGLDQTDAPLAPEEVPAVALSTAVEDVAADAPGEPFDSAGAPAVVTADESGETSDPSEGRSAAAAGNPVDIDESSLRDPLR